MIADHGSVNRTIARVLVILHKGLVILLLLLLPIVPMLLLLHDRDKSKGAFVEELYFSEFYKGAWERDI